VLTKDDLLFGPLASWRLLKPLLLPVRPLMPEEELPLVVELDGTIHVVF
jgi:hypothetical protein